MSVAILKEIREAEDQAEQIESQAMQKAREIVTAARKDASEENDASVEQAENEAKGLISTSEKKALQDIEEIKGQIQAQCDDIRKNSNDKLNDAVDFIVGRIVKP